MIASNVAKQRWAIAVPALAALLLALPVAAQHDRSRPGGAAATQGSGPASSVPDAPIGHRQPTAADVVVVPKTGADLAQDKRDKALNKKLQICRGC